MTETALKLRQAHWRPTRRLVLGIIILGVCVLGFRLLASPGKNADTGGTAAGGDFTVDGTLETDEVDIASKLPGRLAQVMVEEGDRVRAGQVVAIIGAEELDAKYDQGIAGLRAAEAQLDQGRYAVELEADRCDSQVRQAQAGVEAARATLGMAQAKLAAMEHGARPQEKAQAQAGVEAARGALGMAQAKLSALKEGARPQEIEQAKQGVEATQAAFDTAKKTYQRVKGLADEGLIAQQKADEAEMAYRNATAQLQAAKAKLNLVQAGARPQEIDAATEQVRQATAALKAAKNTLSMTQEGPRREEIDAARQQVRQARAGVDAALRAVKLAQDARLQVNIRQQDVKAATQKVAAGVGAVREVQAYQQQTRIVSPINGRVTERHCRGGEIIAPGYAIMSVAREDGYWVRIYVDESQFAGHHVGEAVQVNMPALGSTVSGQISQVLPAADFATKRANNERGSFDVRALELRVTLDQPLRDLATGMTARVHFSARSTR